MSERLQDIPDADFERIKAICAIIDDYFPDDYDFIIDLDEEDIIAWLYGQLLAIGEDPEVVLAEYGVTENTDEV